jgi:hypothetical protein
MAEFSNGRRAFFHFVQVRGALFAALLFWAIIAVVILKLF